MKFKHICLTIAALCISAAARADMAGAKLAIVYDAGGKFDKSFNQSASEGVMRFMKETGLKVFEAQANYDTQAEQVLRALARKKLQLIVSIGFSQTQPVQKIAAEYPNVHFVIVDGNAQGKNVNSVLFKEQEGSYLVGVAAAMASRTKTISFVCWKDANE
jgi:basic membrane protein A